MWLKHTVYIRNEYIHCPKCKKSYVREDAIPGKGHRVRQRYFIRANVAFKPVKRRQWRP